VNSAKLNFRLRLSEKGYEQRSERAFGGYTEAKKGQNISSRRSLKLPCRWLPGFSDSLFTLDFSHSRRVANRVG